MVIRRFMAHKLAVGSLVVFVLVVIVSLIGGRFWKYGYADITDQFSSPPSLEHPMGTDDIGHDSLAQVLRGAQKSVQIALMVAILATTIGAVIGALAGYYRGWVDAALMRFTDLVLTIPSIAILAVLAATVAGQAGNWFFIGLVPGRCCSGPTSPGWSAASSCRCARRSSSRRPGRSAPATPGSSSGTCCPTPSARSSSTPPSPWPWPSWSRPRCRFLGLGVKAPDTSLGLLISAGQQAATTRPWLFYFPGLFIVLIALTVNFIGDGLRDAFDPTQTRVRA